MFEMIQKVVLSFVSFLIVIRTFVYVVSMLLIITLIVTTSLSLFAILLIPQYLLYWVVTSMRFSIALFIVGDPVPLVLVVTVVIPFPLCSAIAACLTFGESCTLCSSALLGINLMEACLRVLTFLVVPILGPPRFPHVKSFPVLCRIIVPYCFVPPSSFFLCLEKKHG